MRSSSKHRTALHLVRHVLGGDAEVVNVEELASARGLVLRVTVGGGAETAAPRHVIVKQRGGDGDLAAFATTNLATETTALRLLDAAAVDVGPRLLGQVDGVGLVLEDLGRRTVESVLFGDSSTEAHAALVAMAESTARLHRVDVDVGAFAGIGTWTIADRRSGWADLLESVAAAGMPQPSAAATDDFDAVRAAIRSPGSAAALVHGDLTPNNAVLDDGGRCRLIDFEGTGVQHIGHDAAMLRFPFAWYGRWADVPSSVQRDMEAAYRAALAWPDGAVDHALAVGCLAMAVLRLERLPRIADAAQPPDQAYRRRVQIAVTLDRAADAAAQADAYIALADWLTAMSGAIRRRWEEAGGRPPMYPAFAVSRSDR